MDVRKKDYVEPHAEFVNKKNDGIHIEQDGLKPRSHDDQKMQSNNRHFRQGL